MTMIDLRSDALVPPSAAAQKAMVTAGSGDDFYEENEITRELERHMAQLLGKEAALLMPTGTLANAIALLTQPCAPGQILMDAESHIRRREMGPLSLLGRLEPVYSDTAEGCPDARATEAWLKQLPRDPRLLPIICTENTHLWRGGKVLRPELLNALSEVAHAHGARIHLDGARLFYAAAILDLPVQPLAAGADSVMVSLVKGLGIPAGAMLASSAEFIREARLRQTAVGGTLRSTGWIAAAALVSLREGFAHLKEDHRRAKALAQLCQAGGFGPAPAAVESNIVLIDSQPLGLSAAQFAAMALEQGLRVSVLGAHTVRLATSRKFTEGDLAPAGRILRAVAGR